MSGRYDVVKCEWERKIKSKWSTAGGVEVDIDDELADYEDGGDVNAYLGALAVLAGVGLCSQERGVHRRIVVAVIFV